MVEFQVGDLVEARHWEPPKFGEPGYPEDIKTQRQADETHICWSPRPDEEKEIVVGRVRVKGTFLGVRDYILLDVGGRRVTVSGRDVLRVLDE